MKLLFSSKVQSFRYKKFFVALPIRSVPTFIELLIGAMLTQAGFVTQARLAVNMHRHWTSYYKRLQKGKWVTLLQWLPEQSFKCNTKNMPLGSVIG